MRVLLSELFLFYTRQLTVCKICGKITRGFHICIKGKKKYGVPRILAKMFPGADAPLSNVEENRKHWVHIGQLLKLRHGNSTQAMSVEQIISIEEEEESPPNSGGQINGRWELRNRLEEAGEWANESWQDV